MNKILKEIKDKMIDCVEKYISEVSFEDLEDNGAVFYMNGKNGTEFDWYVNDKLSDFMMFYNDENNMGAVKATIYNDGGLLIYVYGDRGEKVIKELNCNVEATEDDIFNLAVSLKNEADDKKIWDYNIEKIDTDLKLEETKIKTFCEHEPYYADMRERKLLMGKIGYVSKRIFDEGWKIGYMCRDEAERENDSGWAFMVGNEDDDYINDAQNIQVVSIYSLMQYDRDIIKYITMPVGTRLIRVSSNEFEEDNNDKEIHMEKIYE